MLALLIGLILAAGLLLRGSWDFWAQSLLFIAAVSGTATWAIVRVALGYVPLPPRRLLAWAGALAALSGLSAWASPVHYYAVESWRVLLLGLWIFCALAVVSKDDRSTIDQALRATGWTLMLLAFYQRYHDHIARPASALLNQNVYAGAILLLLPLAAELRDWLLCGGLFLGLCWSHSVGAWLGIACALVLTRRGRETVGNYLGLSLMFVCLVLVYGKLRSPDVAHRWQWWLAATRMSLARPLLGFGPGAFAYAGPSYTGPSSDLSTLFVHQHFLETAAACGWLYLTVWFGGLLYFLRRGAPHKRFGAVALLVQSMWDYPLSLAGVFWVFCYFAASTTPQSSAGVNVRFERKPVWALLIAAAGLGACWWGVRSWQADRLKAQAVEEYRETRDAPAAEDRLRRSLALAADPEAERALAEVLLDPAHHPSLEQAREAAVHLERAARLNPYRPSTWVALERLHNALGDRETGRWLREGQTYCPVLRQGPPS